ncbi:ERF family protein [Patescibacteria group bacterium]|nr:ERF family protein [Patescibacteria group bacterium]
METKPSEDLKTLRGRLLFIQKKIIVPKNQFNPFGKFNYRSCEDILEAVKPLLTDGLCLTISDNILQVGDRHYVQAIVTLTDGKDKVVVSAAAREEISKKGMDGSQITGAASSYARKYALNGLFLIDDTKDADAQQKEAESKVLPENKVSPEKTVPPSGVEVKQSETTLGQQALPGTIPEPGKEKVEPGNTFLTFKELFSKMSSAINVFELNARCLKYKPDYIKLTDNEKITIRHERDRRKTYLEIGEIGDYKDFKIVETKKTE